MKICITIIIVYYNYYIIKIREYIMNAVNPIPSIVAVPVQTYQAAMKERIKQFTPNLSVQRVLEEVVKNVAQQKMRVLAESNSPEIIGADFALALDQFRALEQHAFSIQAPPSLTLDSLSRNPEISLNQSILRHCPRGPKQLVQIARAFGLANPIRGIIPLSIERLVQHNLIRRFVLNFCLKGELSAELSSVIKPLALRVLIEDKRFKNMGCLRGDLEAQALQYLQTKNKNGIEPGLVQIVEALEKQARSIHSGLGEAILLEAIAMRAADLTIETYVHRIIEEYDMSKAPELRGYKPLPPQIHQTRRYFMINGGVASGKSSAKQLQDEEAQKEGIDPSTVCPINRDSFKPMLLGLNEVDEHYKGFFASFTEDEAFLLRDAILRDYQERLKANTAPHIYIDQVSPAIEILRMTGDKAGRGLDLTVVYTPVETSFCLANYREKATGYVAVTAGVLNTHASVSNQLAGNIQQAVVEGRDNIRLKIIANIGKGILAPVAHIDYSKKTGSINDKDRLLAFFHKKHINTSATKFCEIYDPQLTPAESCHSCVAIAAQLIKDPV